MVADKCFMDAVLERVCAEPRPVDVQDDVLDSLNMLSTLYEYNHWAYSKIRPFIRGSVCEVGCGIGNVIQFLLNYERVVGLEPFGKSISRARRRFADHRNVSFVQSYLSDCPSDEVPARSFDSVICLQVLEHIPDDQQALVQMRELCKPDGSVVVVAAAQSSAYGTLDEVYGHIRRYDRRGLARMFDKAGLTLTHGSYTNAPGYFGWLWHSRIRRSQKIPAGAAGLFNRMVPFIDAFERIIRLPFGQSLIMVGTPARRPVESVGT